MAKNTQEIRSFVEQLMSFVDFLFVQSNYLIFEKPLHKKGVKWKRGYRRESNRTDEKRAHSVNLHFPLVTPSRSEMEEYVLSWASEGGNSGLISDLNGSPKDARSEVLARWNSTIMKFIDDFVKRYLITMRQTGQNNGRVQMGYRPHEDMEETRISMFVSFQTASKIELTAVVDEWLAGYLG